MLEPRTIIQSADKTQSYWVRHLPIYQPYFEGGCLRAALSTEEFGSENVKIHLCHQNDAGEWVSTSLSPSLIDESCHPDLERSDAEYILLARQVLSKLDNTAISILLDTQEGSTYRHEEVATVVFSKIANDDPHDVIGLVDENTLDLLQGIRALERSAKQFWSTLGAIKFDDGGLRGDHELVITRERLLISYRDCHGAEITLSSQKVDGRWAHKTSFGTWHHEQNIIDSLKDARKSDIELFQKAFSRMERDPHALPSALKEPVEIISTEYVGIGKTVFHLLPGTLRNPGQTSQ